jgi:anti-sigma B factor antagonist
MDYVPSAQVAGLTTRLDRIGEGVAVLSVEGELDLYTVRELERALIPPLRDGTDALVVDLEGCGFLDSSGLSAFIRADKEAKAKGIELLLVVPPSNTIRRVFALTNLDDVFQIEPERDRAISRAAGSGRGGRSAGAEETPPAQLRR